MGLKSALKTAYLQSQLSMMNSLKTKGTVIFIASAAVEVFHGLYRP